MKLAELGKVTSSPDHIIHKMHVMIPDNLWQYAPSKGNDNEKVRLNPIYLQTYLAIMNLVLLMKNLAKLGGRGVVCN